MSIERKKEIRSHLGDARLVLSKKKRRENILRSKLLSIPINSFVRRKLFFRRTINRVSGNLRFSNNRSSGFKIQWIEYAGRKEKGRGRTRRHSFRRIRTTINTGHVEGLVFTADVKNWQSTRNRKNPLAQRDSAIDWKKEGRKEGWNDPLSFNNSSIIPLVNDFQILKRVSNSFENKVENSIDNRSEE